MLPDGWAGLGLLLLRMAVGTCLALYGSVQLLQHELTLVIVLLAIFVIGSGLALLLGYFTTIAAVVGASANLGQVFGTAHLAKSNISEAELESVFLSVVTVAIVCLGPGAFSLDAMRHGRHEIIIPQRPERSLDD